MSGVPGVDVPDGRGRTGLDRVGLDLARNPRVRVRAVQLLTSHWFVTRTTTFDFQHADGTSSTEHQETDDRGDGACILLYDARARIGEDIVDAKTIMLLQWAALPGPFAR